MQRRRAVIFFIRTEQCEAAAKPLPERFRIAGYRALNRRIVGRLRSLFHRDADLVVVSDGSHDLSEAAHSLRQHGASFGERITNAVADTHALGYEHVVVVGNDCPAITAHDIRQSFLRLDGGASIVVAPTFDGGAYLIGLDRDGFRAGEFRRLPWQTHRLMQAMMSLSGCVRLPNMRADFDAWRTHAAERALARLLADDDTADTAHPNARPAFPSSRMKAFTRIHLTAPPFVA